MNHKHIVLGFIVFLISFSATIFSAPNAFAYQLVVRLCCPTQVQAQQGVDIGVINTYTKAVRLLPYNGLPPERVYFYFTDYEMPPDSTFRVCALYHGTSIQINCEEYIAGTSTSESADLSLSQLR